MALFSQVEQEAVEGFLEGRDHLARRGIDHLVDRRDGLLEGERLGHAALRIDADFHVRVGAKIAVLLVVVRERDDDGSLFVVEPVEAEVHVTGRGALGGLRCRIRSGR